MIGERVRDKIAASKRKGLWVGGPIPLGYRSVDKVLEIVPEEAELVRKIFADYLRLGSIAALAASLDSDGIRPTPRPKGGGSSVVARRFTVGPLAHMLKNRFYIGEIVYRGEIYPGAQQPILEREVFDAVQAMLEEHAVQRSAMRSSSPAVLTGLIFDDRGNPMTPTHANKTGVRYRYYTSHALIQGRRKDAGSVSRIPAPDVEAIILASIRSTFADGKELEHLDDRALIERCLARATLSRDHIDLTFNELDDCEASPNLRIPFHPKLAPRKGVTHRPAYDDAGSNVAASNVAMDGPTRIAMLTAIARSKTWLDRIMSGDAGTFDEIAQREKLVERHVRFLAPLAFLSPRIVDAIADGRAPADLTISRLARALPLCWTQQEQQLGIA